MVRLTLVMLLLAVDPVLVCEFTVKCAGVYD